MNESKKISKVGKKWLYFTDVCMSLQDPNTIFTPEGTLWGHNVVYLYSGKDGARIFSYMFCYY
jgi:hypothetical protein